ncbi:MAG TPA: hypothetical protein PLQ41_01255 [bacterium]|nr:hypothetical protein [bacterium]HPP29832.1 hypothetical protein [bacterium]
MVIASVEFERWEEKIKKSARPRVFIHYGSKERKSQDYTSGESEREAPERM